MDYEKAQCLKGILFNEKSPEDVEKWSDEESTRYDMDPNKRNLAVIITNEKFKELNFREGADEDTRTIKNALESLDFEVEELKNQSVKQMKKALRKIQNKGGKYNCFVCVISTHGKIGDKICGNDKEVLIEDLVEEVLPGKCPGLEGKPKLFFIQACRGKKTDEGASQNSAIKTEKVDVTDIITHKIPVWVDVLVAYSSVSEYYSWRNVTDGSWFLQALAYILQHYGKKLELQELMLLVNHVIASKETRSTDCEKNKKKQIPSISNTLTKELYFEK
ncbi:caspase-7-like [Octopus sinensis]|uniref:Caspase-7-like n=1 Tax=Octopus sinensis TaxID=2607531 RepID=A0A6P7U7J0_9MOLL|nr:caspase-7-like [Octopus sinensis]